MKAYLLRWGITLALVCSSFYFLQANTDIPDIVLESVQLLKTPIEDLLPDLEEPVQTDEYGPVLPDEASLNLEAYDNLSNQRAQWNEMRSLIESGRPLFTPLPSQVVVSTSPAGRLAPDVPPPPGFTVQLPYDSRLTVSGRKTIGVNYKATKQSNTDFANQQGLAISQSTFELTQQLQVRINGQVGRKVTVNVDFDDTKEDKKDISIIYKGDPDEIVQRAAFGDINLSIPQSRDGSEFVGYSKQLFGVSAELKYKALKAYLIGSRTKGQTETKEFLGNVILQRRDINDISYIRRKYYDIRRLSGGSGDLPINVNTIEIYIDDRSNGRQGAEFQTLTGDETLLADATSYTGLFKRLSPGTDFTVDPVVGLVTFRNTLKSDDVILIDYTNAAGQQLSTSRGHSGEKKIFKFDESSILKIPATEDLTHYNIGTQKIVRDNGQGNFIFQVRDANNNDVSNTLGIRYLPNNGGNVFMDFETGIFNLQNNVRLDSNDSNNASIYQQTALSRGLKFFIEFRARLKTYTLRPNIVLNSERIVLGGRTLTRDVDYFIDYDSGFITFFNEDQITEDTRIVATYDFSPFGIAGAQQDTLVGERVEVGMYPLHPILSQSLVGSTILYDFAPKQTSAPDIRQASGSFLVSEGDIHFKDIIFDFIPLLKSSLAAEIAQSRRNPNTFGKALIDNLEGTKDETSITLNQLGYQVAVNPSGVRQYANALATRINNETIRSKEINPNFTVLDGDRTQVLNLDYDLGFDVGKSSEASVVTTLNTSGLDLSEKLFLEMYVQGDGTVSNGSPSGIEMNVTLGQISENSDGSASSTPKTEDANKNNLLDVGEDVGWSYVNPDGSITQFRPSNLQLDSQDLDRNGVLDSGNPAVGGSYGYAPDAKSTFDVPGASGANRVDFTGWKFVQIPLNFSSGTATAVKHMRISLRTTGGQPVTGRVRIGKVNVTGSRWKVDPLVTGSTFTASAINNEDNSSYTSPDYPDFNDLNKINSTLSGPQPSRRKEQSLALTYGLPSNSSGTARNITLSPMDFTAYGSIRFFLYGDGQGETFFFRAGSDTDYNEFAINVTWNGWREIFIQQKDETGDQRPDTWANDPRNPGGGRTSRVGSPDLTSVSQLRVGVANETAGTLNGQVWFNELHAGETITRVGLASRYTADFEVMGWGTFGGVARDIDRNFETFTSALTNQDRKEQEGYLTISRLTYFPMKFTYANSETITPTINTFGSNSLVSVLREGRVEDRRYAAEGTLQIPRLPRLGLTYDTNTIKSYQLFRTDKTNRYGANFDYVVPGTSRWLPRNIQLGYKRTDLLLDFQSEALIASSDPFAVSDTKNITHDFTGKLGFEPVSGFTFTPTYALSTTREFKDAIVDTNTLTTQSLQYDRLRTQTAGFDGALPFRRWFSPRIRYTMTTRETFGIPLASDLEASRFKTVDRTSNSEIGWDFSWRDLTNRLKVLQSMNVVSSYLLEDGDTWEKVASGYNSLKILTVRQALSPGNSEATRRQLTQRETLRSTQRLSPFDWANWVGFRQPLRTLSLTSTVTDTKESQETTGTPTRIKTRILPDLLMSITQTEYFFGAAKFMSNSQLNLKAQYRTVDTVGTTFQKVKLHGGDWRFTLTQRFDIFASFSRQTDTTDDLLNHVRTNDAITESMGFQAGFNLGRWRFTPKYDQTKSKAVDSSGRLTTDLKTRVPALQLYADFYLPAGLKLPFADMLIFSNRIRTTSTISLTQKRSSLNALRDNTDSYGFTTSADYELTSNVRLQIGGDYAYVINKISADANSYTFGFNSLLTIQF